MKGEFKIMPRPKRELSQEEWKVLLRDLTRFYLVALICVGVMAFLLGWLAT
jgi:hypothetical protein